MVSGGRASAEGAKAKALWFSEVYQLCLINNKETNVAGAERHPWRVK